MSTKGSITMSDTTAALPPVTFDPWDNRHVRFPLGLLATLLYMAERADDTGVVPKCDGDPCSFCTAMQDAESVMNRYNMQVVGHAV